MYSVTFAMTVIFGIAAANLFLGFATAVLLGRGPKSWLDMERSIVLHPVALRGLRFLPRPKVERIDVRLSPTALEVAPHAPDSTAGLLHDAHRSGNQLRQSESSETISTADTTASPIPRRLVLPAKVPADPGEDDAPEASLQRQLDNWRDGDLREETPSLSGLQVQLEGDLDPVTRAALSGAIYDRIKAQLRRDRRVLRLTPMSFAWFSADVPPPDALMPVERIRQIIAATRFQAATEEIGLKVVGGVVCGTADDKADCLINRLNTAWQYAVEKDEFSSCLDDGSGPQGIKPYRIEVEESECQLVTS